MYKTIDLTPDYARVGVSPEGCGATLQCIVPEKYVELGERKRKALIICPGGGYEYCSEREAEPVALRFAGAGFACFVLRYSVYRKKFPTALLELASAVKYVRDNSKEFDIDKDKIIVMGFSAGGHLAASMATMWNSTTLANALECDPDYLRVNGSVLCYPVITSGQFTHEGSILNLIGEGDANEELREFLSLERHIDENTPPTFLWHCADDGCVPVENSLLYMAELSKNKIPFEAHIYPEGGHGLALCNDVTATWEGHFQSVCEGWADLAIDFIRRL